MELPFKTPRSPQDVQKNVEHITKNLPVVVTGSRATGAALLSLLTKLEAAGLIDDQTVP